MTVTVSETGTRLTFIDVAEDSRCRAQANCIWAGRVVVEVKADTPCVGTEMLTLATRRAQAEARDVLAGQSIELRGAARPATTRVRPFHPQTIAQSWWSCFSQAPSAPQQ